MTKERYDISRGGDDEPGLILIGDSATGIIVARSSDMALKHVQELVRLANRTTPAEPRECPSDEPHFDELESETFFNLMQAYRHAGLPQTPEEEIAKAFETVKNWIRNARYIEGWVRASEKSGAVHPDETRLDWLQATTGRFANIDRITSVNGKFNGYATLREAIDKADTLKS